MTASHGSEMPKNVQALIQIDQNAGTADERHADPGHMIMMKTTSPIGSPRADSRLGEQRAQERHSVKQPRKGNQRDHQLDEPMRARNAEPHAEQCIRQRGRQEHILPDRGPEEEPQRQLVARQRRDAVKIEDARRPATLPRPSRPALRRSPR